jgi:hypothetical protein
MTRLDADVIAIILGGGIPPGSGKVYEHTIAEKLTPAPPMTDEEMRHEFCDNGCHVLDAIGQCRYCDYHHNTNGRMENA